MYYDDLKVQTATGNALEFHIAEQADEPLCFLYCCDPRLLGVLT